MNELALFAGAGGGILGGKLLGWRTICAVEWEPYPASVLCARQNDKLLPPFPVWDDVQTFDGKPWRGIVDVVSGGFPCQDISAAGKGAGISGERSSMWKHMARVIGEVQPAYAFIENSPMLRTRGLGTVLQDLTKMGYDAQWGVLSAASVGANHKRERMWIVAKWCGQLSHAQHNRIRRWEQQQEGIKKETRELARSRRELREARDSTELDTKTQVGSTSAIHNQPSREGQSVPNSDLSQQQRGSVPSGIHQKNAYASNSRWWEVEPNMGRVAYGMAAGVDRLKAIGNGQVPLCAATAFLKLNEREYDN